MTDAQLVALMAATLASRWNLDNPVETAVVLLTEAKRQVREAEKALANAPVCEGRGFEVV